MATSYVTLPMEYFPDPTQGRPVCNGSVYVGEPDLDPEVLANRKAVTLKQEDNSEVVIPPESQPLTTGAGGVIMYNGSPVTVLVEGNYSLKVLDRLGAQVYYVHNVLDSVPVDQTQVALVFDTVADLKASAMLEPTQLARTKGYYAINDGGGALYVVQPAQVVDGWGDHALANGNVALLQVTNSVAFKQFGAYADGVADDWSAMTATFSYAKDKRISVLGGGANCYYRISQPLIIDYEADFDGQMCQTFQETPDTNGIVFDKGASGAANNLNAVQARRIVCGTVAGTGDAFTFRNTQESHYQDLYVPGCGGTAFHVEGSLLCLFDHLEASNALTVTPPWFFSGESASAHVTGIKHSQLNGLSPNSNVYNRCTCTNSTGLSFDMQIGSNNVVISPDAEDIQTPAKHMTLGNASSVIGGNFEGSGDGIDITGSNASILGVNALTFVRISQGLHGVRVANSQIKFPIIESGTRNCTVENVTITQGGSFVGLNSGSDNIVRNVTDTSGDEIGQWRSEDFTPILEFGGGSTGATWFQQIGKSFIDGKSIYFKLRLQINQKSTDIGSATINLNDIYLPSINDNADTPISVMVNGVANGEPIVGRVSGNSRTITLFKVVSGGVSQQLTDVDFSSTDQIWVSGSYFYR